MTTDTADHAMLRRYAVLFWDFDGVIKDSVGVKGAAFEQLFAPFGAELARRVRLHHECHGGMSRYEKLRLYLEWACQSRSTAEVESYAERFSAAVRQSVIDCNWVPGAREYLEANHREQTFVLISATPQAEIEAILTTLGASPWFRRIFGAPVRKAEAIVSALANFGRVPADALVIGDSDADYEAALKAGVAFLLRRTDFNRALQRQYTGPSFLHFQEP
jgi:phosphoglycolate phosphatase-like HAD superfamily hydrolase